MDISAKDVKELRETTGAGMMDCKNALKESAGDMEKAIEALRKKGIAKSVKRADRETPEGIVLSYVSEDNKAAALMALSCETDFVARNEEFKQYAYDLLQHLLEEKSKDRNVFIKSEYKGSTVEEDLAVQMGKVGEKMDVKFASYLSTQGMVDTYVHSNNKIGSMVVLQSEAKPEDLQTLLKDLNMHVAAMRPIGVDEKDVDASLLEKENEIIKGQLKEEGKPDNMIEKIVKGKLQKFIKENTLLNQKFVKNDKMTVKEVLEKKAKELGQDIHIEQFLRFEIGK